MNINILQALNGVAIAAAKLGDVNTVAMLQKTICKLSKISNIYDGVPVSNIPFLNPNITGNSAQLFDAAAKVLAFQSGISVPVNTSPPTISGSAQVGLQLNSTDGTWTNSPTAFVRQWYSGGIPISSAIAPTYVPTVSDIGRTITFSVIAGNIGGTSSPATSSATSAVTSLFPGQTGNLVGHTAAQGYPGSLTPSSGPFASGSIGSPQVYSFLDIDSGASGLYLDNTHSYITFIGCRFQSNNVGGANVDCAGADHIVFSYCSVVPRVALVTAPPSAAWPSAGAGQGVIEQPTAYQIATANQYQYGLNLSTAGTGGPFTVDHCDIWGGINPITLYGTVTQINITDNWMHDFSDSLNVPHNIGGTATYHQDGIGYLNLATGPTNVLIDHNTISGICNGNMIAFQGSSSGSTNLTITRNFMCGGSYAVVLTNTSNITFTDNLFATDIPWQYGPLYFDYTSKFHTAGNTWARNILKVRTGTTPYPGSTLAWTGADDGKFMLPNSTVSVSDFV